ncbi:GspH/FimT family pseudopilin [Luteimonas terricola]|uniref:Type II secretion system protein H n=1 Tax=Luteimonas terricola TaxID=645597 RepID=A0ABQ2EIN9_9GAMM|nr:GspH/FimT family pseudopilin [Luteimonas terricola]GGK10985.1 hypothetical protein GCM10011394_20510 [Luteimonas terricola]
MSVVGLARDAAVPRRRPVRGFTLIELLVTVALLAILVALAAPSFANLINSNRLAGAANDIVAALQVARMEAIRRGQSVVICPSTDGASCAGAEWSRMIVFSDRNGNQAVNAPQDVVLRDITLAAAGMQVVPSASVGGSGWIRFSPDGLAWVGANRSGAIGVCSNRLPDASNTRDVRIATSRVSVSTRNGTSACTAPSDN